MKLFYSRNACSLAAVPVLQMNNGDYKNQVDAYAFSMVRWLDMLDGGFDPYPNMRRFMDHMKEDPQVQKALIRESA